MTVQSKALAWDYEVSGSSPAREEISGRMIQNNFKIIHQIIIVFISIIIVLTFNAFFFSSIYRSCGVLLYSGNEQNI